MSSLEVALGYVDGPVPGLELHLAHDGAPGARAAFEAVLLEALRRPPCVVSFSGGRDSSAVLAVAASVARREGLPMPVPVTQRFARVPSSEESSWQEHVVAALGIEDWEVVDIADELDLVGAVAAAEIGRHGVLWPANTHFHSLMAQRARGGTLVTGFGGDEIMSPGWVWERVNWVLDRRVAPRPQDLLAVLAAHGGPLPRRARALYRSGAVSTGPWLTPGARRAALEAERRLRIAEPVRHDEVLRRRYWPSRYVQTVLQSLALLAEGHGARVAHPFAAPGFVAACAAERGRSGPRSRSSAMASLFRDVLTPQMITRRGKASFNGAFWGPQSRAFAERWTGGGIDPDVVDVAVLAAEWARPDPDARSYSLLQHAWAVSEGRPLGRPPVGAWAAGHRGWMRQARGSDRPWGC